MVRLEEMMRVAAVFDRACNRVNSLVTGEIAECDFADLMSECPEPYREMVAQNIAEYVVKRAAIAGMKAAIAEDGSVDLA